jgi:hypothetical protein
MKEMTCGEFDEIVHGYVRLELLDFHLREAALEHTARCGNCAQTMAQAIALAVATEAAGKEARDVQTPPEVEAAVLAEFRSHHRRAAWRRTFEWSSIGAVAAVLLIILWTVGVRSNGPSQSPPGKNLSSHPYASLDARSPVSLPPKGIAQGVEEKAGVARASDAATAATYAASDFVPVPFTGAIAPDDPGMVVRVQLTRASLAQLGYPVAEAPDDDLIRADVLVGEDGWPRGVKLVR